MTDAACAAECLAADGYSIAKKVTGCGIAGGELLLLDPACPITHKEIRRTLIPCWTTGNECADDECLAVDGHSIAEEDIGCGITGGELLLLAPARLGTYKNIGRTLVAPGWTIVQERTDHERLIQLMEGVEDIPGTALAEGLTWKWETFPEYMQALDDVPHSIDFCAQVPHDALRVYCMGERALAEEAAMNPHFAASALSSALFSMLDTGADWLGQHTGDAQSAETYVASLFAGYFRHLPTDGAGRFGEVIASLSTTGGLNSTLREHLKREGAYDALLSGLDGFEERLGLHPRL